MYVWLRAHSDEEKKRIKSEKQETEEEEKKQKKVEEKQKERWEIKEAEKKYGKRNKKRSWNKTRKRKEKKQKQNKQAWDRRRESITERREEKTSTASKKTAFASKGKGQGTRSGFCPDCPGRFCAKANVSRAAGLWRRGLFPCTPPRADSLLIASPPPASLRPRLSCSCPGSSWSPELCSSPECIFPKSLTARLTVAASLAATSSTNSTSVCSTRAFRRYKRARRLVGAVFGFPARLPKAVSLLCRWRTLFRRTAFALPLGTLLRTSFRQGWMGLKTFSNQG